jgi:hypothetical protein
MLILLINNGLNEYYGFKAKVYNVPHLAITIRTNSYAFEGENRFLAYWY